jgi:hypothetical protein
MLAVNGHHKLVGETQVQVGHLAYNSIGQALNPLTTLFRRDVEIYPEQSGYFPIQQPNRSWYSCTVTHDLVIAVDDDQAVLVVPMTPETVIAQKIAFLL